MCLRFIARKEAGDEKSSIPTSNPQKLVHIHFSISTNVLFWSLMPSLKQGIRAQKNTLVSTKKWMHSFPRVFSGKNTISLSRLSVGKIRA